MGYSGVPTEIGLSAFTLNPKFNVFTITNLIADRVGGHRSVAKQFKLVFNLGSWNIYVPTLVQLPM